MISAPDRLVLRELARGVAACAAAPIQQQRIAEWRRHNELEAGRPLVLIYPEGSWRELVPDAALVCQAGIAREWERGLRQTLFQDANFHSDNVVTTDFMVGKQIHHSGWGMAARWKFSEVQHGAKAFDPVLKEPRDLASLRHPTIEYDEPATLEQLAIAQEIFGDLLHVKLQGVAHLSYHLMSEFTALRGLEQVLMDMAERPDFVHEAMDFLTAGHQGVLRQYRAQGLLAANDDNTYHSTGGNGWCRSLRPGADPELGQLWASAESQELTGVSPRMHQTFAMQYEAKLLEPFGLTGYGCCDDLTRKLGNVLALPHIRRISISPFTNVAASAAALSDHRAILSWKPQPAHLVGHFDEALVRRTLRDGIAQALAHDCTLEVILKDTHTCEHHPERFARWSTICHEVIEEGLSIAS